MRRRWIKRGILGGALLFVAISTTSYMFRGTLTRWIALSRLEAALGYDASCSSAEVLPSGRVSLPGFVLRARGVDGDAGEVVSADRVELAVDWFRAVTDPAEAVTAVRLINPVFRLSVDVQTGALSVGTAGGGGASTPAALPPVSVERARLIFGEHGEGWFAPLHEIEISGSMRRDPAQAGVYSVRLSEESPVGRAPAVLEGEINLRAGTGELALRDIDFAALRAHGSEPRVETFLRRLRIGGRLPLATLAYSSDGSFHVGVDLISVDVVAPAPARNTAPGGEATQMMNLTGVTGRLDVDQEGLHADLVGLFEDLDARVIIETKGLSVAADASAEIIVSDYRWGPNPGLLPVAPELAAEFVQRFSGPEATINGRVRLAQVDGVASANGLFTWREGTAAFEDFPYPLLDVGGRMSFDDSGVYVTDLRGVGPTGADIRAEVVAVPPGDDAEITATVVATGVPTDEHLFNAIGGRHGEAVAALFSGDESHGIVPGGEVELSIEVFKRGGEFGRWGWDVRATSPELGVSDQRLGYPLTAHGFDLRLDRERAVVDMPALEGPTGLRASLRVDIPMRGDTAERGEYVIDEAPIDELLISALSRSSRELGEAVERFARGGSLSAEGGFELDAEGALGVSGHARFQDVVLGADPATAGAREVSGEIAFDTAHATFNVEGAGPGGSRVEAAGAYDRTNGAWEARAFVTELDITDESLRELASLSEDIALQVRGVVNEWGLGGVIGGSVEASASGAGEIEWGVRIDDYERLALELGGAGVAFDSTSGMVRIDEGGVNFLDARAAVRTGAEEIGRVHLAGRTPRRGRDTTLEINANDVALDAEPVRVLATKWASADVAESIEEADPAGVADLRLTVEGNAAGDVTVSGRIEPRTLEVTREGARARFAAASGGVLFGEGGIRFDGLRLQADGWDLLLDGSYEEGGGYDGVVDLSAERVTTGLLASLPPGAADAAEAIGLEIGEGGELWATGRIGVDSELVVGFTRARFSLGARVEDAAGSLTIRYDKEGERVGDLELETFRAESIPMRRGRARLGWSDDGASVRVPEFSAECAGGVIRGSARLAPTVGFGAKREYFVDVRCAGVPLAWIVERPEGEARPEDGLSERGLIGGRLRVRGIVGGDGSGRVGRGSFTISGGEILRLPLLTQVFEILNFQPPVGERLEDAAIEFGLAGDRLIFDRLFVQSDSLVVWATGEARLDDGTLDLAVRTRGRVRIPLLSDLYDAFKDELLGARIRGPIGAPEYELEQFPNAGRVLLGVVAPGAGGRVDRAAPPPRPPLAEHVLSTLEPIDE